MKTELATRNKAYVLVAVVALLALTSVGSAYAYSSSVSSDGNEVVSSYLTINMYKDGKAATLSLSDFTYDETTGTYTPKSTASYGLKISTNAVYNTTEEHKSLVYAYGYFQLTDVNKGVAVESVTFSFNEVTGAATIYNGAFKCGLFDTDKGDESLITLNEETTGTTYTGTYSQTLTIKSIAVKYYEFQYDSEGNVTVYHLGDSSKTSVSKTDAQSLDATDFHFLTSRDKLLTA